MTTKEADESKAERRREFDARFRDALNQKIREGGEAGEAAKKMLKDWDDLHGEKVAGKKAKK